MERYTKYRLGDIAEMRYGKLPPDSTTSGSYPVYSGYRYVGYTDSFNCSKGSVIVVARGVGGTGDVKLIEQDCYLTNLSISVVLNPLICDPAYFYYKFFKNNLRYLDSGSAQSQITIDDLKRLEVSLPSLLEQQQIVRILKSFDDKISLNKRINHNLEEQAKFHFEEWSRRCNEEKSIAELSFNILDYSQNQKDKVILLNSSDVTEGVFETLPYVVNKNLKGQFKKRFRKGDVLYSEIRPRNHHYAFCYFDAEDYIASTRLMIIRRNPELLFSDALLYQYLLMQRVEEEFTSKTESRSGTFPQGNYEDLSSSMVPYSRENQIISKTLDALYSIIWLNMEENKRLTSFRDALLPQLMSGYLTC